MDAQTGGHKPLIENPEGAAFMAEQSLLDGADRTSALIVTVHQTEGGSAGNMWIRKAGEIRRLIDERLLPGVKADRIQLAGEVYRYTLADGQEINADLRLNLGVKGLMESVTQKPADKEQGG